MEPRVRNEISGGIFFSAVIQGGTVNVTLPPTVTPALFGLPAAPAAFTGREDDLARLLAGLAPPTVPTPTPTLTLTPAPAPAPAPGADPGPATAVTAVVGLGGVGKTALVLQAATRALADPGWFPGGVLFVDLFGYDPERRVPPELALDGFLRALGLPEVHIPPALQDRARLYRSVLTAFAEQGRRILVVLDNASGAGQVEPLLPADGRTAVLVTSRDALDLDARRHQVEPLDPAASVALLDRAIRTARGTDDARVTDSPADAAAVAELCAGLPLALRIVAALLADFPGRPLSSVREDLESTDDRLDVLGRRDRAVRAAFNLSYDRLGDEHARTFRLLSLNPGPDLSTEAATHLTEQSRIRTELLLQDLARAHLIEAGRIWGRWRLHDLVRLYAVERGRSRADADRRGAARTRLFDHYVTGAREADQHFEVPPREHPGRFPRRTDALAWLDAEHRNLLATVLTAAPDAPGTAVALTLLLSRFLHQRRHFDHMLLVAEAARPVGVASGDPVAAARTLNMQGTALRELGRYEECAAAHRQAAAEHRALGDDRFEAASLSLLGLALDRLGRPEEAVDIHRRAVRLLQAVGERRDEAVVRDNLGAALQSLDRAAEAVEEHRRAAELHHELADRYGEADSLNNLGAALLAVDRCDEAVRTLRQAVAANHGREAPRAEADALHNLGQALWESGEADEAVDHLRRAVALRHELGDRAGESSDLRTLGGALHEAGRLPEAAEALEQSAAAAAAVDDRHGEAVALLLLGATLPHTHRPEEALTVLARSATTFRELGDRHSEAGADHNTGLALRELGRLEEAGEAFSRAALAFHELGDTRQEIGSATALAETLRAGGLTERALSVRDVTLELARTLGDRGAEAAVLAEAALDLRHAGRYEEALALHELAISGFWEADEPRKSYLATLAREETVRLYEDS
ncbi:ATP-binding protein [Kitasatospora sp. NPDC059827]|uniref:ATP-binding protein n=1 Tax=Kitasatospora sp. NPDC059827 TaxID=3346964 RepID=UPI003660B201